MVATVAVVQQVGSPFPDVIVRTAGSSPVGVLRSAIVRNGVTALPPRKVGAMMRNGLGPVNGNGLDWKRCDRARVARDARFDGRFFTGALTTRIYCRPTCPVKPARSRNVVFFPTAAAAEAARFRPCLRCRPETAPGTPAWRGAAATVSHALRLIERGFTRIMGSSPSVRAPKGRLSVR